MNVYVLPIRVVQPELNMGQSSYYIAHYISKAELQTVEKNKNNCEIWNVATKQNSYILDTTFSIVMGKNIEPHSLTHTAQPSHLCYLQTRNYIISQN